MSLRAVLALLVIVVGGCERQAESGVERYRSYVASPATADAAVRATFFGTATLLFDDGETAVMTDGFFSRPALSLSLDAETDPLVEPDVETIERWLERANIERLAAIMPVHSHYDHAMDTPVVAERTGAQVIGSRSTANIARGWGLAEDQIIEATHGKALPFGAFTITLFESRHAQLGPGIPYPGEVTEPLRPPVPVSAYKEGGSYSILIQHPRGNALVQGSAGWLEGALEEVRADVVFLGIGGLGLKDAGYRDAYWRNTVGAVKPSRVVPIHWDDFTRPLGAKLVAGGAGGFEAAMQDVIDRSARQGIRLELPPPVLPIGLY